jgi:hypothetical protein
MRFLFCLILFLCFTEDAAAQEGAVFNRIPGGFVFISNIIESSQNYIHLLFRNFAVNIVDPIFTQIVFLVIIWYCIACFMKKPPDFIQTVIQVGMIVFINEVLFAKGVFIEWFYLPLSNSIYDLAGYIIGSTSKDLIGNVSAGDLLIEGFRILEEQKDKFFMAARNVKAALPTGMNFFAAVELWIIIGIFYLAVYLINFAFQIVFAMGILASTVMLSAMPFALALFVFPKTKHIFFNVVKSYFGFALMIPFAAVSMGITLFLINQLDGETVAMSGIDNKKMAAMIKNPAQIVDYFENILVVVFFSFIFLVKSSEFAFRVVSGGGSSFGNVSIPMMSAGRLGIQGLKMAPGTVTGAWGMGKMGVAGAKKAYKGINKIIDKTL